MNIIKFLLIPVVIGLLSAIGGVIARYFLGKEMGKDIQDILVMSCAVFAIFYLKKHHSAKPTP